MTNAGLFQYPPTKRRRGKYAGPLAHTVRAKNIYSISGRFLTLPLQQ